jgi:poly(A) polymerase
MISTYQAALRVIRVLRAGGYEALFAGGCVRDMLRRARPKDYDVATSARPEEVERLFRRTILVGKAFGVVRARVNGREIEVATFRAEGRYLDGRHPSSVRFVDAEEDALRRDFTVNGLFYDPVARKVIDFVEGRADLRKRRIRAIGNPRQRFQEDRLRLLRGVRFAAQLGFAIEPSTWKALVAMAPRIRSVSAERIRDELTKLLTAPHAVKGLRLLYRSGLLRWTLPEAHAMAGVSQPREFHPEGDVLVHTILLFRHLRRPGARLAWAALLHDIGKPPTLGRKRGSGRITFPEHTRVGARMADAILRRLRFSTVDREAIVAMVANHMTFKDSQQMRLSTLKRLLARPTFEDELALHRADCLASHGSVANVRYLRKKQRTLPKEEIRPPRLLTGHDLISMGLKPGPVFGRILHAVEEAQLEGVVRTREEALRFVREQPARGE